MDPVEEIRAKLSIEELMGSYVQMKKSGRNFKALCPFHQEKTPSFIISPDKGLAYCFGCRKGGDIFACIQELESVDFPTAVKILAEKTGVEIKKDKYSPAKKEQKDRILKILQESHLFFQKHLKKYKEAQSYLENRGYDMKTQQELQLGYAPDSFHELTEQLEKKGYKSKDLLDAGVVSQKEMGSNKVYDRFRNRIIFPIHNPQGKLVAFGGRTLSKDANAAKYLNSPETASYHKGQTLYCFHRAKQTMREKDESIVVEGYFDALTAHLQGFSNTVASLGTALTEEQIKLIGRFTKNIYFAFDADTSGQTAASRSIEIAQRLGYNTSIVSIPSGKDPDEAIRTDSTEWQTAISEAVKAMDYEFNKAFQKTNPRTIDGKKQILKELLPIINRLPNAVEQEHYLKKLALDLETSLKSLMIELKKQSPKTQLTSQEKTDPLKSQKSPQNRYSRGEYLIGLLANHPKHLNKVKSTIQAEFLGSEEEKILYKNLIDLYNQADKNKKEKKDLKKEELPKNGRLQLLELYAEEQCKNFTSEEEIESELDSLCYLIRQDHNKQRLKQLPFEFEKNPDAKHLTEEHTRLVSSINNDRDSDSSS